MTNTEFGQVVESDVHLAKPLRRVAGAIPGHQFSLLVDSAMLVALFPVVRFVLIRIGLPWLHTASRWSELKRLKVEQWLDEQYQTQGFDLQAAEVASNALCSELERITDAGAKASWQQLQLVLKAASSDDTDGQSDDVTDNG